jgi:membrane-bound lytic murein transglycosylase D
MRFGKSNLRTAVLISSFLTLCGCAHRPASLLPSSSAPSLQTVSTPPAPTQSAPAGQAQAGPQNPASSQDAGQAQETAQAPVQQPDSAKPGQSAADDPVGELVARAEKEYQAGVESYHAGQSEEAKRHFDSALNALLDSSFDVHSDHRLEDEFNRIVAGVNDLYPSENSGEPGQSAQSAQEEPQQKSEPAPIDETNGVTPSADARTLAKAEAEIKSTHSDLPLMMTDQVAGYIAYFSGRGRESFENALARSGRYREMMLPILKQEGVPQDLIYLAQAESGFHPLAVSRAGARGIWQFMGERGRGYGLYRNQWVDDRQDPEKSTRAAARHLKDLYNQFGDWYLAMAAYNSGPGTVQAAVKRTGYADFWELYRRNVLPKETKNYVPIILAVTLMAKNPSQYGLDRVAMELPSQYDSVTIDYPVDLRLVADCVNATADELQGLNPSLLRLTTPREGSFVLHLPAGTKDQYESSIAAIPAGMRLWWRYPTVHEGDTIASLARTYRTTVKSINEANHLDGEALEADAKLIIPIVPGKQGANESGTYARRITRYKVRRGDTVETVAENFGVPALMIRRWNGLRGSSLAGRKVLAVHLPVSPSAHPETVARTSKSQTEKSQAGKSQTGKSVVAKSSAKPAQLTAENEHASVVHHTVKSGETLYSIATFYKTTVAALERDNRNVAVLHPGMVLIVQSAR